MKYEAEIDGRQVALELEQRNGRVTAKVGERDYDVEVIHPEDSAYLIFIGSKVYEARAWQDTPGSLRIKLRDRVFSVKIKDRKRMHAASDHGMEGRQHLIAPMPGKVVRVLLKAGDEVKAGQGVVIVEAMKMQNEIKSSKDGLVAEVRVSEGETVNASQVLAIVE
jgi:biotin carboxyl carrier protein